MMTAKPIQINETISFPKVGRKKQIFNWYQKAQLFKINDTQIKSFFPKILNLWGLSSKVELFWNLQFLYIPN